jgi:hypothetical protein
MRHRTLVPSYKRALCDGVLPKFRTPSTQLVGSDTTKTWPTLQLKREPLITDVSACHLCLTFSFELLQPFFDAVHRDLIWSDDALKSPIGRERVHDSRSYYKLILACYTFSNPLVFRRNSIFNIVLCYLYFDSEKRFPRYLEDH